jgi:hypothetical protein
MKQLCFAIIGSLLLCACWGGQSEKEAEEGYVNMNDSDSYLNDTLDLYEEKSVSAAADEFFMDFFFHFVDDERFQLSRVVLPLPCTNGDEDFTISPARWEEMRTFIAPEFVTSVYDRDADLDIQKDTAIKRVNVWRIVIGRNLQQNFHFHKVEGKWKLTSYSIHNSAQTPMGSFYNFFSDFCRDTLNQEQHILFPLKLVSTSADDPADRTVEEIQRSEWAEMSEDLPLPKTQMLSIDYGQPALSENRKIMLVEGLSNGLMLTYRFDRTNDRWRLYEID